MFSALATVLLFAAATTVTLHLKHVGERAVQAQRDLQAVVTEFHFQDALEWRVIAGRSTPAGIQGELATSRARTEALIAEAARAGLPAAGERGIQAAHRTYTAAVDRELVLLNNDQVDAATQLDEAEVDPAFTVAQRTLAGYADRVADNAARAERVSDLGVLLTLGLALLLTGLTHNRRRLAEIRRGHTRHSEARYRALVDQSADIVMVVNRDGSTQYMSPAAERLLNAYLDKSPNELARLVHPDDRELLMTTVTTADPARPPVVIEIRVAVGTREQTYRHYEVTVQNLLADPAVEGMLLAGHDVTDRRTLQREVEHRALHDGLTGLPNRALLADRLTQALRVVHRQGTVAGLLLIDLDRFKEINDTLGHHYGDQLLAQVGPRLAEELRQMDTVARLGGDEFAVLLPSVTDVQGATEVAHKLQAALGRPFRVEGVQLDVEASIGVVVSGAHGDDASTLLQRADIAMYVAKQRNLRVSTYDREIDSNTPERLALLGDLRRALQGGELFLHFQPQVDLGTGRVCGAEALLRWQHPERGLVPPADFIPLAENTGMIGPLTEHVLELALTQIRVWVDQGRPIQVAVNLSARNLLDEQFDETVAALLAGHGVGPELLKLEVTESAIMTDPVRATQVLERLAAQGLAISIDDFGAGYTSIRQLKDLPIDELKVDQSFVTDMETDAGNAVIVRSVIELGHNLGQGIVAEGVETVQSLDRLRRYGCDIVQGYFISRPMSAGAFDQWRDTWAGLPTGPPAEDPPAEDPPEPGPVEPGPPEPSLAEPGSGSASLPGQRGRGGRVPHT